MTFLETLLTFALLTVVPWCAWTAIDLWRLRGDVDRLDLEHDRLRSRLDHTRLMVDTLAGHLADTRSRTADLDVPDVDEHLDVPDTPTTTKENPHA